MSNMSHCRFQNTASDLRDCMEDDRMDENYVEDLSDEEARARRQLISMCIDIAEWYGDCE